MLVPTHKAAAPDIYIEPSASMHSTFSDASAAIERGGLSLRGRREVLDLSALARGRRTLVVGEPGVGKTEVMRKLEEHLQAERVPVVCIELRQPDALARIESAVTHLAAGAQGALLLDGLDEVPAPALPALMTKLAEVTQEHVGPAVFISGRWVFVKGYERHFAGFQIYTIHPFDFAQVREYLSKAGRSERDINVLIHRLHFGHRTLVLQIPRYLHYLARYANDRGVEAASRLSRNDLFEHFIYVKLDLEDEKRHADEKALVKRLLEKLALVMEIYQVNVISKDELMTFFDELESDLKLVALAQVGLDVLYRYSLLSVSREALDKVEFENAEFQEYLAAKEISRFADPNQAAFGFAVAPEANEIRPTWYNTLTFLVDMRPELLSPVVEFSGLLHDDDKLIDDNFFTFVSRLDPVAMSAALKRILFLRILSYHSRMRIWMPYRLGETMSSFFEASLESELRTIAEACSDAEGARRYVPLANLAEIVGALLRDDTAKAMINVPFWRATLIGYATDTNENGVLQRHALSALRQLSDSSVIDELDAVPRRDELVVRELLETCIELDPDHPATLKMLLDGVKRSDIYARRGLYRLRKAESVRVLLIGLVDDRALRRGFLEGLSRFREEDAELAEVIKRARALSQEILELAKSALVALLHYEAAHQLDRSSFLPAFWQVLSDSDSGFAAEMVRRIKAGRDGITNFFYARRLFALTLEERDLEPFFAAMREADDEHGALDVMSGVRHSGRPNAEAIYEAGRRLAPKGYARMEATPADDDSGRRRRLEAMLSELRTKLQPKPGKFSLDVFEYYNHHASELVDLVDECDRARLRELIVNEVFAFVDPARYELKITSDADGSRTFTMSSAVSVFEDAAETARLLAMDVTPFRTAILSLIPYAYDDELKTIFGLVPHIKPGELGHVLGKYVQRDSDLWRYRPVSLVEAAKRYRSVEAVPVLRVLATAPEIDAHARAQALEVAESLAPDHGFLQEIFTRYHEGNNTERDLAEMANAKLILSYADPEAIRWRLDALAARAAPLPKRHHRRTALTALEGEVSFRKTFARPLMLLNRPGYEPAFLRLLEQATTFWSEGRDHQAYAEYLWDVVFAYFDNLKEARSYEPLRRLEAKMLELRERAGVNWLSGRMAAVRRSYLAQLGRPIGIGDAVARYNGARNREAKPIRDSNDLLHHLRDAIDTDLRRWVVDEGAYRLLLHEDEEPERRRRHEELVQKTLKTQLESILLKRGFQVDLIREAQSLNDKRVDFLVRYGFAGPVVIEVKLTSNTDLHASDLATTRSYRSMMSYVNANGAAPGIFLVINNTRAKNIAAIVQTYERIPRVYVHALDCAAGEEQGNAKPRKAVAPKRAPKRSRGRRGSL